MEKGESLLAEWKYPDPVLRASLPNFLLIYARSIGVLHGVACFAACRAGGVYICRHAAAPCAVPLVVRMESWRRYAPLFATTGRRLAFTFCAAAACVALYCGAMPAPPLSPSIHTLTRCLPHASPPAPRRPAAGP